MGVAGYTVLKQLAFLNQVPEDCKKLREWHQRSEDRYNERRFSRIRSWRGQFDDDWDGDWDDDWDEDED